METRALLMELGVNTSLHDQLMAFNNRLHEKAFGSVRNRPRAMQLFDRAFHESHGKRVEQIYEYRKNGGKAIGTFCIYVPDEIALAAGVLPLPLCGGSH